VGGKQGKRERKRGKGEIILERVETDRNSNNKRSIGCFEYVVCLSIAKDQDGIWNMLSFFMIFFMKCCLCHNYSMHV